MHETVYKSKISVSVKVVLLIKYLIENRVEMYVIFNLSQSTMDIFVSIYVFVPRLWHEFFVKVMN